ncbi:MAG: DoxX family protein [Gemmatimonadales bacterium]
MSDPAGAAQAHSLTPAAAAAIEWPVAAMRIYTGVVFAATGVAQFFGLDPWQTWREWPATLQQYLAATGQHTAPGYDVFVRSVLVPHAALLAPIVAWAHIIIGVSLVLGLSTRLAAGAALVCLINYMALTGVWPYHPDPISALASLSLAVLLAKPDSIWSLTAVRRRTRGGP